MDYEMEAQQEAQHQATQTAAAEMTRTAAAQQTILAAASESRATLSAASNDVSRKANGYLEDLRDEPGGEIADVAQDWLSDAREALDAAQDAAQKFFETLGEQCKPEGDGLAQQMADLSEQAAAALRDFALKMDQQAERLAEGVYELLDNNNTEGLTGAFRKAAEDTAALQDQLDQTLTRLDEQLQAAQSNEQRNEQANEQGLSPLLDVIYDERKVQTTGGTRFELSAEAVLRHDDDKLNPRHDPELAKEDRQLRENAGGNGRDATHLLAAMFGAAPDARNLVAFNHVMNRSEMQDWERQTEERRRSGEDLRVKVTAIFKADQEGKRSDIPMAIVAERENVQTGQRDLIRFGNFPSPLTRAFDEAREKGHALDAEERKRANSESYDVNRKNQAAREQEQQRLAEQQQGRRPDLHVVENEEGERRERDEQKNRESQLEEARRRAISEQEKLENERRRR